MPIRLHILIVIAALGVLLSCATTTPPVPAPVNTALDVKTVLDFKALAEAKQGIARGDSLYLKAFQVLQKHAKEMLDLTPPSVMDKVHTPPSGDKHDYTSMSPYWWPNPESEDGLPYIRKDGVVNPERNAFDKLPGAMMSEAVRACALMYFFTEEDRYAEKAAELLRVWFLDPESRMNPNLNYGQFVPGVSEGRSVGIIETRNFVFLTEYETLIANSSHWTHDDHLQFKSWMTDFLNWLVSSDLGQEEQSRANNHGSWCDFQLLALSQYCDQPEVGQKVAGSILDNRLKKQFDDSGKQPEELERTKSYSYSVFNLSALVRVAILAENHGIDLSRTDGHKSALIRGIDFLIPFATGDQEWAFTQISSMDGSNEKMIFLVAYAQAKWPDQQYAQTLNKLVSSYPDTRYSLITSALMEMNSGRGVEEKI